MDNRRPLSLVSLAALAALTPLAGCVSSTGAGGNNTDQIDCSSITCDWTVVQGTPSFGSTWHEGDVGVDLSAPGKQVLELRDVFFASQSDRQLVLRSVLVRDPSATMAFELDFYAPGQVPGQTFWDRQPVFLLTRHIDIVEQGVTDFHRPVLIPSEGAAVVLRIVKDGTGHAMLDEITLGQ